MNKKIKLTKFQQGILDSMKVMKKCDVIIAIKKTTEAEAKEQGIPLKIKMQKLKKTIYCQEYDS